MERHTEESSKSPNRPDTSKNGLMKKHPPAAPAQERKKRTNKIMSRLKSLDSSP